MRHEKCPQCGSSDANSIYDDGHTHCFACEHSTYPEANLSGDCVSEDFELEELEVKKPAQKIREIGPSDAFRGMNPKTVEKFAVTVGDPKNPKLEAVYPYYDAEGHHIANKVRYADKEFMIEGDWRNTVLFGQNLFPAGSAKQITLVEGQDDAMAAFEMQGSRFPCVSVASASSAVKDVSRSFEYLNAFDNVVLAFDADEPGKDAARKVAQMFKPGKCRILTMQHGKDANEYLQNGKTKAFIEEWWNAVPFKPDGLKLGSEMWETVKKPRKYETIPYPWLGLNTATYGIRLSEFVLVTAQTKVGKTQMLKEIANSIREETEKKPEKPGIGFLFFEESNEDTCLGLMSVVANKPLHLPDVREGVTEDELHEYFNIAVNSDRIVIWDHFGSNAIQEVLNKIRHMHNMGCKYIILDHLSIIVSDQSGDERKMLDEISTKLKMLCMELNISVIAVIHQNRNNQIRSSAGPEQIANITIKLHREMEDPDEWRRNVTRVTVQYNRFCGRTGPVCYLFYNPETGRLVEMTKPDVERYESKKPAAVTPEAWPLP